MWIITAAELTVSTKELALLDYCCVTIEGESDAEFGVVAAVHEPELWRRDGQTWACHKGESDETVGRDNHRDRQYSILI